jgi:hypothetical protein
MLGIFPLSTEPLSSASKELIFSGSASGVANVNANAVARFLTSANVQALGTVTIGTTLIAFVDMQANGTAQVSADAFLTAMGEASVTGVAIVNLDANRFTFGGASVSAEATVNLDAIRIRLISSSITGDATTVLDPVAIFSAVGDIEGLATTDLFVQRTTFTSANVSASGQIEITAELVGENWSVVPQGTNIWLRRG